MLCLHFCKIEIYNYLDREILKFSVILYKDCALQLFSEVGELQMNLILTVVATMYAFYEYECVL